MSKAIVYEPAGSNETPLKYTAGLVLAVPVDCDLVNVRDISIVKVAIRTPDQKVRIRVQTPGIPVKIPPGISGINFDKMGEGAVCLFAVLT